MLLALLLPCCIAAGCSPFITWTITLAGSEDEIEKGREHNIKWHVKKNSYHK
jgi:hypothetical protein